MTGVKRNSFEKAQKLLSMFPVLAIVGARQVGKTTLSKMLGPDWTYVDLEDPDDFRLLKDNPKLFFQINPKNVIIDEAQIWPDLFPVLRGIIDQQRDVRGRFILTGSSSPALLTNISESLAGRIATIELGTLKANEFYEKPLSPFYELFQNSITTEVPVAGKPLISASDMQRVWLRGGYPEPALQDKPDFFSQWMNNYRDTYVNRDLAALFPRLNKENFQRFVSTLSKLSGTIINKRDLSRAIEVGETTIKEYIDIAEGTFIWRSLPSYERNIIKSIIKMPKGYIRDTGLLHYLTRINDLNMLIADPLVGSSFEAFVIEEILKGLESLMITNWQASYYRTRGGAEIDLILDGHFGVLPIEIKFGTSTRVRDITSLSNFVDEHDLPLGLVINQSPTIAWLTPKIMQLPVGFI